MIGNRSYRVHMAKGESAASLLRELRRKQGQTLRSAASELGVAASQLSRMERGERPVGEAAMQRLSDYYNVPAEVINLATGRVPADVVAILLAHPEELANLRKKFGT